MPASTSAPPSGYVKYFGMHRMPFDTAPNPDFAFATRAHEMALLRLQDSVEQRLGLALLKGDIGTGKSTLAHLLVQTWGQEPDRFRVALIDDPSAYTPAQFMRLLVGAFGLEPSRYVQVNKDLFRGFLLDEYEAGRTVVVLLDEAQTISAPNMATLLMLSNLQTATAKLVQIALLALPNFDRKLSYQPALSSRIATRGTLDPLIGAGHRGHDAPPRHRRRRRLRPPVPRRDPSAHLGSHAGHPAQDLCPLPQRPVQCLRTGVARRGHRSRPAGGQRL